QPSNSRQFCLKFWYYMKIQTDSEDSKSYIQVGTDSRNNYREKITAKEVISEQFSDQWQEYLYSFTAQSNQTVVTISMNTWANTKIALDDLVLLNQPCQRIGDCDFEAGG